ncbi:hypothetical protein YC2023_083695 [Brassica napus]
MQEKFYNGFFLNITCGRSSTICFPCSLTMIFSDRVMEVINPKAGYVWIHDYHLMVLPTFLRKRFNMIKLPFPHHGAIRVNPWGVEDVAEAVNLALKMSEAEKQLRHEENYHYVSIHDVA